MSLSDLSAPLKSRRARRERPAGQHRTLPVARLAGAGIAVLLGAAALRVLLVDTPDGGRPVVEIPINSTQGANAVVGANAQIEPMEAISVGPELELEEVENGVAGVDPSESAATDALANVPDLVEETEFGAIPRMSATGETPFEAYARPAVSPANAGGKSLIAIIVTGLGINHAGTLEAIEKLPDAVTLAFAPYGRTLEETVGSARAQGHEIFLEVPLEPFDYPENDPGPDTLLTGQVPRDNMTRLYRVMGKFGGYAGLINNMGARFTASGADFAPLMEEVGARGLGWLDDGSSNRSIAPQLAEANRVPFARADRQLDANPARAPILARLEELEVLAKQQGQAVGLVTALPVSIQTVAEWARGLEEKGVLLVPASALMK